MKSDHLQKILPNSQADKSWCSNLQKGKEVVSVLVLRDVLHSVPRIQLALHCQRFLDDPMLLWSPNVILSDVSIDAFAHFMEILNGFEPQFSRETINDLMLLARKFGYDRLIASLAPH
jgi:hypothetical protein